MFNLGTLTQLANTKCVAECSRADGYEQVGGDTTYRCALDADGQPVWVPVGEGLQCERRCPAEGAGVPPRSPIFGQTCNHFFPKITSKRLEFWTSDLRQALGMHLN